jgi:L-threonylcarbamoyladenylate synthase
VLAGPEDIARAAERLAAGGVVAFPTDTVYGVGALTTELDAIERIFRMKGRPKNRALIVHLAATEALAAFADEIPDYAVKLADAFWPGPLTLVLKKKVDLADAVTGGIDTVGLRVPNHEVALALINAVGALRHGPVGIAAPSANRFGEPPPDSAEGVVNGLGPAGGDPEETPDIILDGGTCPGGVPSTVLSCVGPWPRILRHGATTAEKIESVIGRWVDQ